MMPLPGIEPSPQFIDRVREEQRHKYFKFARAFLVYTGKKLHGRIFRQEGHQHPKIKRNQRKRTR